MMLGSILALSIVPSLGSQQAASWDALANEYDLAFERWAGELSRSGAWERPESERPPSPALEYWPRFEALADQGEGRATLWLLGNLQPERGPAVLARVTRAGGDAEWLGTAFFELGASAESFPHDELVAYLEARAANATTNELRAYAGLALAEVVQAEDPAEAAHLRLWAAVLLHLDADMAPGEELAREDVEELGGLVLDRLDQESRGYFARAYRMGADGTYYPISGAAPDPKARWRPVVEELATRGSTRARLWALSNAPWELDLAGKERLRGFLEAVASSTLAEKELESLAWEVSGLVSRLGLAAVEPSVRKLIDASPEGAKRGLLFGLGDAVCQTAGGDEERERGLAILREVRERWPETDQAKRAEGRIFRYTNLVVGKPVPDFETVDADGNAFKLSDYRGKVTVVDFWGFW